MNQEEATIMSNNILNLVKAWVKEYWNETPNRGDLVTFFFPEANTASLEKLYAMLTIESAYAGNKLTQTIFGELMGELHKDGIIDLREDPELRKIVDKYEVKP